MHNRDIFSIFFNMKVYCVFSLESPHRGDSNKYIHYIHYTMFKTKRYPISAAIGFFEGTKNEFETAVVNDSSVFEALKFYCICKLC